MKKSTNRNYLQWHVFERDSYTCILCTRPAGEMHHVIPRSQGGANTPHNLVSVCRYHHLVLHGQEIAGIELTREEAAQTVLEYVSDCYADEWAGYEE